MFYSCGKNTTETKVKASAPQELEAEITKELANYNVTDSVITVDSTILFTYNYFKKNYDTKLNWFALSKLNANGDSLISIIKKSSYYGLIPNQYHLTKILNNINLATKEKEYINVSALVKADLLLSDAYYLLGVHLNKGRFYPDSLLLQINYNKLTLGWDSILLNGYKKNNLKASLDSLEPKHYHYKMLKKELAKILNNPLVFNFDSIPFKSQTDSLLKLKLITKNLIKQGLYDTASVFNDSIKLSKALNELQKKWFIQPDGKLGKYTKQALTYNREKIIRQINMSLERWRWEESKFPNRYAFINIPQFWLTVYEKDTVVMQSAVVCGKPETQTPILKSKIDHMLIYPYWNAPLSIATKEILPAVQRDTSYLRKKNFEVLGNHNVVLDPSKIPWKRYTKDYLPVRFRQRIGNENSLGIVKFNFYNPFGVYLHDTNSKRYFKTSSRAQSHGCIRLEKFIPFANFLIRDDSLHYRTDSLLLYFIEEEQKKIQLRNRLPIYIRYYTAKADSTGLKLYLDIYGKDEEYSNLLYKKK